MKFRTVLFLVLALWGAATARAATTLQQAEATLWPEHSAPMRATVTLPHRWERSFPREGGTAAYVLQLPQIAEREPHALFFSRIGNQAEILVDGEPLARLGRLGDPSADYAKAPVWIDVPASRLRRDGPTPLEIRVTMQANRWGGVSQVRFGPASELRPAYQSNYRWRQVASVVIVLALSLMGLMAGGLWWRQRDDLYGLLSLTALFGVVRMADRVLVQPPLPWPLWGAITASAFTVHLMLMARFALEAVEIRAAWVRAGFWVSVALGCVLATASFLLRQPHLWTAALAGMLVPGLAVLVGCSQRAWTTRSRHSILLCTAGFIVILTGLRDFLMVRLPESGVSNFSLLPHAVFVFVLFMGWIVVDRYSQQVVEYRKLNASLEQRVAAREAELNASYEKLARQSELEATLQERQRIMRDIHDGVGAHLVSLLNLIKRGDVHGETLQKEINVALDELRMAVDSLQPVDGDLATVLATLRYRLQPRLEAAGLKVEWDVEALPPMPGLTPQTVLQVQRVLLEAFTNVIRHARATTLTVWARSLVDPPRLALEVRDDGVGFAAAAAEGPGLGLRSMRSRSQAIGGHLSLQSEPGCGSRLRLELPNEVA